MILSVSRRTDIPAFYTEWFMNRIHEGFVMTRNPMSYHQVSKIPLSPDVLDCIVFWSKNPAPLLPYLDEIGRLYPFYFQFTVNAYEHDMEPNVAPLEKRLAVFREIAEKYGRERVIWRYDPLILTPKYDENWHIWQFERLAGRLSPFTDTCVFSFVDIYDKIKNNLKTAEYLPFTNEAVKRIAGKFARISSEYHLRLKTCAEDVDLASYGIEHSCCIDPERIEKIIDLPIKTKKDPVQRAECHCVESIDIGQYNTCRHGCRYCYANYSMPSVEQSFSQHDPSSPMLIGHPEEEDKVTDRKVKSLKIEQMSLFD